MRVLHFLPVYIPAWQYGGPVLSVSRLCEGLARQGVDVRVITTNKGLPDLPKEKLCVPHYINGVEVIYYPVDNHSRITRSRALVDSLPAHMDWAQLLHLSSIWQPLGLSVQHAAHEAGIPIIQTLRGALSPYSFTRGFLKKILYFLVRERPYLQRVASIHCTTYQEANEAKRLCLKPPISLLANPLDLDKLYFNDDLGKEWRLEHEIPLSAKVFIIAGRFHHKKGLDLLPAVLNMVSNKHWHLVVIGDDEDGTLLKFRKSLAHLGLSSRCHWFPSVPSEDLLAPLNSADWLLLPSRHENFGNIVIEALCCGCGVLLSDRVGVSGMLSGCPGVFVEPRMVRSWIALLNHALATNRPSAMAECWVKHKFSQQVVASHAKQIYSSLL